MASSLRSRAWPTAGVVGSRPASAESSRRALRGSRPRIRLRSGESPAGKSTTAWGSHVLRDLTATTPSSVAAVRRPAAACARRAANQRCPVGDTHPPNGSRFAAPLSPAVPPRTDSSLAPPPAARPLAAASPKPRSLVVLLSDSPCLVRQEIIPKGHLILCKRK